MTETEERYCWQGDKLELGGWLWKKARVLWQLFLWGRSVSRAGLLGAGRGCSCSVLTLP